MRRPRYGDPLPADLADHAGAIIFGGPMSANDEDDYLRREIDWIGVPLREGKPFIGICLGAQMLARHLGHRVYRHPQGKVEIGYHPIRPTEAGRSCCDSPFPEQVYQWHREGFDLPCGATLLAEGQEFEVQAFRYENAFGFQFHPEVTYAMICRWTVRACRPAVGRRRATAASASAGLVPVRCGGRALARRLPAAAGSVGHDERPIDLVFRTRRSGAGDAHPSHSRVEQIGVMRRRLAPAGNGGRQSIVTARDILDCRRVRCASAVEPCHQSCR